jgi:hypothetical protein
VAQFDGERNISLYPNPVSGHAINLRANFQLEMDDKIEILDNLGNILTHLYASSDVQDLSIENDLKPGVYILRYTGKNYSFLIRFTKK